MVRSCLQSRRCLDELMLFVSFQILGYRHSQSLQVLLVFSMGSTKSYTTSREASSSIFLYFHDYSHSDLEEFFFHPYWYIYGRPEGRRLHQRWRETWVICIGSRTMSYRNSTVAFGWGHTTYEPAWHRHKLRANAWIRDGRVVGFAFFQQHVTS